MKEYYCWKCQSNMPFLEEDEWEIISPLLTDAIKDIKDYRSIHDADLYTAMRNVTPRVTEIFEEITGLPGVSHDVMFHHRLADWGSECANCGNLLRTSKATYCAHCGHKAEKMPNKSL